MYRYIKVYLTIFNFSLKSMLSYRFNMVFKLLYGPAYIGVIFLVLQTIYSRTQQLAGWTHKDALLLFSVSYFLYFNCQTTFGDGIKNLLWRGISEGEVDKWLLKPGSTQFYLTFSSPNVDFLALWIGVICLFFYQIMTYPQLTLFNFLSFLVFFALGHVIYYLSLSTYATLGFYFVRAQQIAELFDKSTDLTQYPLDIFPKSIQFLFVTFLPIAFFSYVPTLFLRGLGSLSWIIAEIIFCLFLYFLNRWSWQEGLKHYSSASS